MKPTYRETSSVIKPSVAQNHSKQIIRQADCLLAYRGAACTKLARDPWRCQCLHPSRQHPPEPELQNAVASPPQPVPSPPRSTTRRLFGRCSMVLTQNANKRDNTKGCYLAVGSVIQIYRGHHWQAMLALHLRASNQSPRKAQMRTLAPAAQSAPSGEA